jgi:hypothetical protein
MTNDLVIWHEIFILIFTSFATDTYIISPLYNAYTLWNAVFRVFNTSSSLFRDPETIRYR